MSFLNFLKNIISAKEEKPSSNGSIKLENLGELISKKKKENQQKENEILNQVTNLVSDLILELKEELTLLRKVDLKEKKVEERIKIIVTSNLGIYTNHIENLIDSLKNIKNTNLDEIVSDLNKIFSEFKKKSNLSFEKANFLVGDEIKNIKESIKTFFKKLTDISEQEKNFLNENKTLKEVETILQEINKLETDKKEIKMCILEIKDKLKVREEEHKEIEKNIEKIRKSQSYIKEIEEKETVKIKQKKIEQDTPQLKQKINFKALEKTFHSNEKRMSLIKSYKQDFNHIFNEESQILDLIEESKKQEIHEIIARIKQEKEEINRITNKKDLLTDLQIELNQTAELIKDLELNKEKEEQRILKLDTLQNEIKETIKASLLKINIELK
jgi:hypothetical protein